MKPMVIAEEGHLDMMDLLEREYTNTYAEARTLVMLAISNGVAVIDDFRALRYTTEGTVQLLGDFG
jgi:hypothetical protein